MKTAAPPRAAPDQHLPQTEEADTKPIDYKRALQEKSKAAGWTTRDKHITPERRAYRFRRAAQKDLQRNIMGQWLLLARSRQTKAAAWWDKCEATDTESSDETEIDETDMQELHYRELQQALAQCDEGTRGAALSAWGYKTQQQRRQPAPRGRGGRRTTAK